MIGNGALAGKLRVLSENDRSVWGLPETLMLANSDEAIPAASQSF
jgi:hypothetical protein